MHTSTISVMIIHLESNESSSPYEHANPYVAHTKFHMKTSWRSLYQIYTSEPILFHTIKATERSEEKMSISSTKHIYRSSL
jgi:hypothetical protein